MSGAITAWVVVAAASAIYSGHQANDAAKATKNAAEDAKKDAKEARDKLAADELASVELAANQVEERKRALARNKTIETGPLGVEEGGQKVKTALGQ